MKWNKEKDLQARIRELEEELQHLRNSKKYGLVWDSEREPEQVVMDCQTKLPILEEVKERKIISDDSWDSNLLIEGDNYHALQVLSYTHKEAIDVIYIDPPYNTGNKDFIYNDKIVDSEDTYRHSKWLNFMEKRLRLAYDLLKEDGVIFISIDDNEQAQLKLLCDEIFGENNFIANICRKTRSGWWAMSKHIATNHDYVLIYGRDKFLVQDFFTPYDEKYLKRYKEIDENWRYFWDTFIRRRIWNNNVYKIKLPSGKEVSDKWNLREEKFYEMLKVWDIRIIENWENWSVQFKQRMWDSWKKSWSIINDFNNTQATEDIRDIFNDRAFDYPKPINLIKYLLQVTCKWNNIKVLDFTAGSGTTGHAVLDLNKEDGGKRKFILCTNNENNICEEVTYERVKRVSQGYTNAKGKEIEGLGGNLRYYKTAFVKVENLQEVTDEKKLELTYNAWELLAIKEWIYNERLKTEYGQVFENMHDIVAVYFKESTRDLAPMAEELGKIQAEKWGKVIWYIYGNPYGLEAFPMIANLELKDIPDPILKVYREINKV